MKPLTLSVLAGKYGVAKLPPSSPLPPWTTAPSAFMSITRTKDELSIVAAEASLIGHHPTELGWRAIHVLGPLDFALTGILAGLTQPLAQYGISIFAVSTYETDYILVKHDRIDLAISVLTSEGHTVTFHEA